MSIPFFKVASDTLSSLNDPSGNQFIANLSSFNTNLQNIDDSLNTNNAKLQDTVTNQNVVDNIVQTELSRVQQQQTKLSIAQQGQQRILNLNDSYRKRYGQYLKIAIAITVILLLVWIFKVIESRFPDAIPSFIYDLLTIVIVSLGLIYCYLVYSVIGTRDPLNYDQLNLAPPPNASKDIATAGNAAPNSNTFADDLTAGQGCAGQDCCATGTNWDAATGKCVVTTSGFTTLSQSMSSIEPMTPFEYTDYAPLK